MKYSFICAQGMAQQHPDTFEVADMDHLREVVQPGVQAKVATNGERIWTTVTEVEGNNVKATFANQPFDFDAEWGDPVEYELRHIYNVMDDGEYVA